jgi:hypothetical protein
LRLIGWALTLEARLMPVAVALRSSRIAGAPINPIRAIIALSEPVLERVRSA